jgi:hypothetical protein
MPGSIAESYESQGPLNAPLQQGLETISQDQEILFTQYVKLILPLDGYVFWVRSDLVGAAALCNCYNCSNQQVTPTTPYVNPTQAVLGPPGPYLKVQGSLHYSTSVRQSEDETMAVNSVIFTAQSEVNDFNLIGPTVMYIGTFEGRRFAFSKRDAWYKQAGLYHYQGDAVYPALASQLVDDVSAFDTTNVIVSNSLPIWLALNQFMPMYPSFLVEENIPPPYASVHIPPDSTTAVAARPAWGHTGTHSQLVKEKVKITVYGLRNFSALDFQDYVFQNSLDNPTVWGLMNMPVMQDEKRIQSELTVIAQKKSFEMEVNYYQIRVRDIARQLIQGAVPDIYLEPL